MKTLNLLVAITLGVCPTILGQTNPPGPPPGPPNGFVHPGVPGMRWNAGKVITGAPYSADTSNSIIQTLADGNTITRTNSGHVARDSQGRTFSQQDLSPGPWAQKEPGTMTFLSDPVAGYTYVLDPAAKIAMRRPFKARNENPGHPPPDTNRPDASERVESDLGQQVISGVTANGKSITRTIPAGAIGNSQPIVEKTEIWTSPDLQIVVLSKHSDPRMGQSTYAVNNIRRGEPNAALFQVPSDYTIKDAPPHGEHGFRYVPKP